MPTSPHTVEAIDGRTARAVRTKDAIVDACLGLIDEGDLRPTGPRIAERAGVSVRSIFQHFDDLDALFGAVGDRITVVVSGMITRIDPASPLPERVDAFVAQRTQVLEVLTPVLRAALVHAASSPVIRQQFEDGHRFFVDQLDDVFAVELAASSRPTALRDSLAVVLAWASWDLLRGAQGRSVAEARAVVDGLARSVLAGDGHPARPA